MSLGGRTSKPLWEIEQITVNRIFSFSNNVSYSNKGNKHYLNTHFVSSTPCGLVKRYGRPLLQVWLLPDLITIPNSCVRENSILAQWYWLLVCKVSGSNPVLTFYFCHAFVHLFLCYRLCS